MIRQASLLALAATLAAPMIWADRAERAERTRAETERVTARVPITEEARAFARSQVRAGSPGSRAVPRRTTAAEQQAVARVQAPGVTQINLFDLSRESYFVVTETLPVDTTIQAFLILPDQKQEWGLEALRVLEDLKPGFSLKLPAIRTLGDFWQRGLTTYTVVVTLPNGTMTMSSVDFGAAGYSRDAADVSYMVPGITAWREYAATGGDNILEVKGRFLTDALTYVVLEDQVAPKDAFTVVDSSTIRINLNMMPYFNAVRMLGYQLTVAQGGWCDNLPFRHTPR